MSRERQEAEERWQGEVRRQILMAQGPRTHSMHERDRAGNPVPLGAASLEAERRRHAAQIAPRNTPLEKALADLLLYDYDPGYRGRNFYHLLPRGEEPGGRLIPILSPAQEEHVRRQLMERVERERAAEQEPALRAARYAGQERAAAERERQYEAQAAEIARLQAAIPAPYAPPARPPQYGQPTRETYLQKAQDDLSRLIRDREIYIAKDREWEARTGRSAAKSIANHTRDADGFRRMLADLPTILPDVRAINSSVPNRSPETEEAWRRAVDLQQGMLGWKGYYKRLAEERGYDPHFAQHVFDRMMHGFIHEQQTDISRQEREEQEQAQRQAQEEREANEARQRAIADFERAEADLRREQALGANPRAVQQAERNVGRATEEVGLARERLEPQGVGGIAETRREIAHLQQMLYHPNITPDTIRGIAQQATNILQRFPELGNGRDGEMNQVIDIIRQLAPAEISEPLLEAAYNRGQQGIPGGAAAGAAAPQPQHFQRRLEQETFPDEGQPAFRRTNIQDIPEDIRLLYRTNPMQAAAQFPTEAAILQSQDTRPQAQRIQPRIPAPEREYSPDSLTPQHLMGGVPSTADNVSIAGTAPWLGGPSGMLYQYLHRQFLDSTKPYEPYPGDTIANLSAPQMQAYDMLNSLANDATGHQSRHERSLSNSIGFAESPFYQQHVAPHIRTGSANIDLEEAKRLNPFSDEYLENLAQRKRDKFERDTLPRLQAKLVGSRAINTGARSHFITKALEDNERQIAEEMEDLRVKGLTMGMTEAGKGRERQLQAAHHATVGQLGERTQAAEAARLRSTANKERNLHQQLSAALLSEEGKIHQMEAQRKLDAARAEHMRARLHPIEQQQRLGEALRGLPSSTSVAYDTARPAREAYTSPATAAGSLIGTLAGLANQQGPARHQKGGRVKKAMGGILDIPEKIDYMNSMNQRVGQLESSRASPFWSGYTNLMANIGASKRKNLAGAVGESLPSMVQGWQGAVQQNEQDADKALAIRSAYIDSLEQQEARKQKLKQGQEALEIQRQNMNIHAGSAASLNKLHDLQGRQIEQDMRIAGGVDNFGMPPLSKEELKAGIEKEKDVLEKASDANKRLNIIQKQKEILKKADSSLFNNAFVEETAKDPSNSAYFAGTRGWLQKSARNAYLGESGQNALAEVEKLSNALVGTMNTKSDADIKTKLSAMPRSSLPYQANIEAANVQEYNASEDKAKGMFYKNWKSELGSVARGDPDGAFDEFKERYKLIRGDGSLNEQALKIAPKYIRAIKTGGELPPAPKANLPKLSPNDAKRLEEKLRAKGKL